jgi:hypothetical protein
MPYGVSSLSNALSTSSRITKSSFREKGMTVNGFFAFVMKLVDADLKVLLHIV